MKWSLFLGVTFLWLIFDQLTKALVVLNFRWGESWPIWLDRFHFTFVKNYGAAFGILAESHPEFRQIFFLITPLLAMGLIFYLLWDTSEQELGQIAALGSVLGGALGNYVDRLKFGYVVDFIDFHWGSRFAWPAFNLADVAIVLGVGFLLLKNFRRKPVA